MEQGSCLVLVLSPGKSKVKVKVGISPQLAWPGLAGLVWHVWRVGHVWSACLAWSGLSGMSAQLHMTLHSPSVPWGAAASPGVAVPGVVVFICILGRYMLVLLCSVVW